ncbi:MAG TPA: PIN domain-containing protein [Spirochaetia bacterium]|nr:PIN domain-containing protein [Spirochaetia bacterium]
MNFKELCDNYLDIFRGKSKVKKTIRTITDSITILPVDAGTVRKAIDSKFSDFEDAMQYFAAEHENIEIIITRNKKDCKKGTITTMTAEEFITAYKATSNRPEV